MPTPTGDQWTEVNVTVENSTLAGAPATLFVFHEVPLEFQFPPSSSSPPASMQSLKVAWGQNGTNSTTLVGNECVPTYSTVIPSVAQFTIAYAGPYQRACGCSDTSYYASAYLALGHVD